MTSPRLTPLAVLILGLLTEDDMHPYEMLRLLRLRGEDRFLALRGGTFYHTVTRLQADGLIDAVGVDREGNRPERTIYTLRDEGRAALTAWVRVELPRADRPTSFRVALSEASELPAADVVALLTERIEALREARSTHENGWRGARAGAVPEQYLIDLDREVHLMATDLEWTRRCVDRITSGEIPWGPGAREVTARYESQRKAARE